MGFFLEFCIFYFLPEYFSSIFEKLLLIFNFPSKYTDFENICRQKWHKKSYSKWKTRFLCRFFFKFYVIFLSFSFSAAGVKTKSLAYDPTWKYSSQIELDWLDEFVSDVVRHEGGCQFHQFVCAKGTNNDQLVESCQPRIPGLVEGQVVGFFCLIDHLPLLGLLNQVSR